MDSDDLRRKRRRLSPDDTSPPSAPDNNDRNNNRAFVDLTGDSSESEGSLQPQPRQDTRRRASRKSSKEEKSLDSNMTFEDDAAFARHLQAELDGEGGLPAAHDEYSEDDDSMDLGERPDSGFHEGDTQPPTGRPAFGAQEVQTTIHEFVQSFMKAKCGGCRKMLFKETDILAYAQGMLDDDATQNGKELDCRSCGSPSSYSSSHAELVKVWALLCFFDSKSKHNTAAKKVTKQAKKPKSSSIAARPSRTLPNNGTGYGGSRAPPKMPKMPKKAPSAPAGQRLGTNETADSPSLMDSDLDEDEYDFEDEDEYDELIYEQSLGQLPFDNFAATYGQAHSLLSMSEKTHPNQQESQTDIPRQTLDEDDQMTANILGLLSGLLPSLDNEDGRDSNQLIQSLLLSGSILERAADLLRNNHLADVTNQADLYIKLLAFLEILSSHPSTSPLVLGERLIRSPGSNILMVSLGKSKLVNEKNTDTAHSLARCMRELAIEAGIMLKSPDINTDDQRLFQSIKNLNDFILANGDISSTRTPVDKNHWHRDLAVLDVVDEIILERHSLVAKGAPGLRPTGQMKRIMQEIAMLKTSLPDGIFVRHCETRPDVMKVLIIGPKDSPYENGLFEFDLLCGPGFPQKPPSMDFRTTGGGMVHFNPNLYACGKICLSLLGTWAGEPWDPKQSTLLQIFVSIQAMIFCDSPWQNEPGREGIPGQDTQSKAYNRSLHPHTVQTAMLDWMEQRSFSKTAANVRLSMYGKAPQAQAKHDSANIWTEVVKKHFDDNAEAIIASVGKWVEEAEQQSPPTQRPPGINPFLPSGDLTTFTTPPAIPAGVPSTGGAPNPFPPFYYPLGYEPQPYHPMMAGPGHVLGGAQSAPQNPSPVPLSNSGMPDLAAHATNSSYFGVNPYNTASDVHGLYGQLASSNPYAHPALKPFYHNGKSTGPSGTGLQGKTLSGVTPGDMSVQQPFLPSTMDKMPPHKQQPSAQEVRGANTRGKERTLSGEAPPLLGGDDLIQMLRGAVEKMNAK